jgi:chromosome segregation ATPase
MSDELEALQANIVAAVQQELGRFSHEVADEVNRLRDELGESQQARTDLEKQVTALAGALQQSQTSNTAFQKKLSKALEDRLSDFGDATKRRHEEMNTRLGKVVDEANVGISASVESLARPVMKKVETRQDGHERDLKALDKKLRKFDQQAGKMANHINELSTALQTQMDEVSKEVLTNFEDRLAQLVMRIDEVSATAARQQAEVSNIVGNRVDTAESRLNDKITALESRVNDEVGQRVADIDAHVGRISAGLDETVGTLSDRLASVDSKFAEVDSKFDQIRSDLEGLDSEAIDEMNDKIASALGEAELVRIEMDRFKGEIGETVDKTSVRLTELETTVQDQHMDVETAVQLERLEEVERAVLALDPDAIRPSGGGEQTSASAAAPAAGPDDLATLEAPTAPLAPPSTDHVNGSALEPPVAH